MSELLLFLGGKRSFQVLITDHATLQQKKYETTPVECPYFGEATFGYLLICTHTLDGVVVILRMFGNDGSFLLRASSIF